MVIGYVCGTCIVWVVRVVRVVRVEWGLCGFSGGGVVLVVYKVFGVIFCGMFRLF